jgi:hypothetical protein
MHTTRIGLAGGLLIAMSAFMPLVTAVSSELPNYAVSHVTGQPALISGALIAATVVAVSLTQIPATLGAISAATSSAIVATLTFYNVTDPLTLPAAGDAAVASMGQVSADIGLVLIATGLTFVVVWIGSQVRSLGGQPFRTMAT